MTNATSGRKRVRKGRTGKLRIGDDWNAITIIALSQSNPLKAVAEFVENSIDAGAQHVVITRGRERGETYLRIKDDGAGIPRNTDGVPDFRYVATHICDSLKRRMKENGASGIQGEFGIGLLSFWTVGEALLLTSAGDDGKTYQMRMEKGDPNYTVQQRRVLFAEHGTELTIKPLLPGIRNLSGEKIQWYLASELRNRIRESGVRVEIVDRQGRKQYQVEPRQFDGRLLHQIDQPTVDGGEAYVELYLAPFATDNRVGLYRSGTRVLEDIASLDAFRCEPWTSGYLQGIVDAPQLNLTPGTRTGVIQDAVFAKFRQATLPLEHQLGAIIEAQRKAEDEKTSRQMLRSIQKAFREALLALPAEEYDWFDLHTRTSRRPASPVDATQDGAKMSVLDEDSATAIIVDAHEPGALASDQQAQKQFFEYAGPLFGARIVPASTVLGVGKTRSLRAMARDRAGRTVEHDLSFAWSIEEGEGSLQGAEREIVMFEASGEPGLIRVAVTITQREISVDATALVTVTDTLLPTAKDNKDNAQGLPGYTFRRAPGELWRSCFNADRNLIEINNGHRDFVFASRNRSLKLRYITRLFAKEMVLKNFPGEPADQLLERVIELSLHTEEHLR